MKHYISYTRVSTQRQGESGLGLEAQRKMIADYIARNDGKVIREYTENESATRKGKRVEIFKAMTHCRDTGSVLVVAKLDRLSRDAEFLMSVVNSGIEVVFTDFEYKGIAGKMMLTIFAALAEYESSLISARTTAALAAAKARGTKLGNPTPGWNMKGAAASATIRQQNRLTSSNIKLQGYAVQLKKQGLKEAEIAQQLNSNGFKSTYNKPFSEHIVKRMVAN